MLRRYFRKQVALALCLIASLPSTTWADSIDDALASLGQWLGRYPPSITSEKHRQAVTRDYETLKQRLDKLLALAPADETRLFQRGYLQSLGHNLDYPDAWKGADTDLRSLLVQHPSHVEANVILGSLYVNTHPEYARNAEELFRTAQCAYGRRPHEAAQRGLFFALYYQGRINDAYRQAVFLKTRWPDRGYETLTSMTSSVLMRQGIPFPKVTRQSLSALSCAKSPA